MSPRAVKWVARTLAAIALLAAPFVIYPIPLMAILCFALFASAFNLVLGYAGLLSFGHAAFFGTAAYVTAYAAKIWGWPPEAAILLGTAAGGLLGAAIGFLAIRRQGIYFAMVTLALGQMVYFVALQARSITGGEDGIQGVPRGHAFGLIDLSNGTTMYYYVLAITIGGLLILRRIVRSPFGHVLRAIRDNEPRAISLGYEVARYKLLAFTLSAALAGLAGGTKAIVFQFAALTDIQWQMSGEVILMSLVGGIGTFFGPIVGATVLKTLENVLAGYDIPVGIATGVIFIACVVLFRSGIVGQIAAWSAVRRQRREAV